MPYLVISLWPLITLVPLSKEQGRNFMKKHCITTYFKTSSYNRFNVDLDSWACLFRCKALQVVSRKMRMKKVNCSRKNILCFKVFDW